MHFEAPSWLCGCLRSDARPWQGFTFDGYQADEFDQLLSADHASRSFLSRLPFKRGSVRRPTSQTAESSDSSARSLFIDDRDAELFGDESISLLLTSQQEAYPPMRLPIGQSPSEEQDEEDLRREEEQLRLDEEHRIALNREKARKLASERGLLRNKSGTSLARVSTPTSSSSSSKTRSNRSASVKSEMNMVQRQNKAPMKSEIDGDASGILPHMRPT